MKRLALAATSLCAGADAAPVSIVTWNLLAPSYARPAKYPWASHEHLDWPRRQAKIVERLAEVDADVVCLQEVDVAAWDGLIDQLSALGYDGVLQRTSRGHPVANAVCVRRGLLQISRTESRSRALITVLSACDDETASEASVPLRSARTRSADRTMAKLPLRRPPLYVANVHLEAGAAKGPQRLAQLRSLLRRVELQRAVDVGDAHGRKQRSAPDVDAMDAALVVAGDFNFDRGSALHTLLATGTLPGTEDARLRAAKRHALLPLRDAYLEVQPPWGPTLRSSYRNGRLLDFVFTSAAVEVLRTMPVQAECGSAQPHQLPSAAHPSDHLPIGALLTWAGEPTQRRTGERRPAWQQLYVENVAIGKRPRASGSGPR